MESRKQLTGLCQEKVIVFIGCGKKKSYRRTLADRMYLGVYFRLCFKLAKLLTPKENIYILSAKYGLISLKDIINPYELKITDLNKIEKMEWVKKVSKKIKKLPNLKKVFICSSQYHKHFKGIKILPVIGMGYQMKFIKEMIKCLQ